MSQAKTIHTITRRSALLGGAAALTTAATTAPVAFKTAETKAALTGDSRIDRLAAAWREAEDAHRRACEIEDETEAAGWFPGIALETDSGPVLCRWETDVLNLGPEVGIDRMNQGLLQLAQARVEHGKTVDRTHLRNARAAVVRADKACQETWRALMGAWSESPHDVLVKVQAVLEDCCYGDAFSKEFHADALEAIAGDLSHLIGRVQA